MKRNKHCQLCLSSDNNEVKYGKLFENDDLIVHQFCLLFAPNLAQNGNDDEGFDGFLLKDIQREIKRVKLLRCCFCQKKGANLGCWNTSHTTGAYHTSCAWNNNVSFEFTSKFQTYCLSHSKNKQKPNSKTECQICFEKFNEKEKGSRAIHMPCCKNTWFHRDCLQKYALNAGVFFKCPLCGNKENFDQLNKSGIFFPHRDALWELEPEAFSEFTQPLNLKCEYHKCQNKELNKDKQYMWELCHFCGANGVHLECIEKDVNDRFTCYGCEWTFKKAEQEAKYKKQGTWISDEELVGSDDEKENKNENLKPHVQRYLQRCAENRNKPVLTKEEREAKYLRQKTWMSDEEVLSTDEEEEKPSK